MGGPTINNQEDWPLNTSHHALEKFDEDRGIHATFLFDHEPHMASRGNRRNEAHSMARARGIGAHVGSIAKENIGFCALRQGFYPRVLSLEPLLYQSFIALVRAMQWLL